MFHEHIILCVFLRRNSVRRRKGGTIFPAPILFCHVDADEGIEGTDGASKEMPYAGELHV